MKIQKCSIDNNEIRTPKIVPQSQYNQTFKAGALSSTLGLFGNTMQGIENGGFLVSFLIQDALGMTLPRAGAAFLRDKEVTGQYNMQEGFEVLGREGLTGPCMMAVAPIMFGLAAKFGRTTSVNSQLIKRFGNSLKEILAKPDFDKSLLNNKEKFQKEFFKTNVEEMLVNTLGKENVKEDSVKYVMEQIANYQNIPSNVKLKKFFGKGKYREECLGNIAKHINDIKYSTSSDLNMLDKLNVGSKKLGNIDAFSTKNTIEAMIKYSEDAITLNKNLESLNQAAAENLKDAAIAKRFITNISTMAATLGVLSVLPKIYARSAVAPGARTAMLLKEAKEKEGANQENKEVEAGEISFKGKKDGASWASKFGKKLSKYTDKKFVSEELEYNGHNFTNSLMAGLSLFGLLAPRGMRAYSRAQVDENGKKDLTELYEILIRDISSSLAVVFTVPMLTRACVTSYENKSGFVLMQKDRSKSKLATSLDLLNPYSKAHVLKNSEMNSLYNGIDSHKKMLNFCKYINDNDGDLQKIFAKSEHAGELFNENSIKLEDLNNLTKKEKNKKIISFLEELGENSKVSKESLNQKITKLMSTRAPKNNKILAFARGLNSVPGVITTFLISPYLLGWFLPRLTYANTRRLHEKAEAERQQKQTKINASV